MASAVNLDSLWGVWNDKSQPDTNRLKAMYKIAWYGYLFSQPDSAFYFAQMQYDLAESVNNKKQMATALNTQGVSFGIRGNYAKSIDYFTRSLKIDEEIGDKRGIAMSLGNIGLIYQSQGEFAKAIDYHTRSLKINEELGNKKGIAASLNNIGNIYKDQGDYVKAMDYYNRSLKIKEELGDKKGIAQTLNNIGVIYNDQGDYAKAIDYHTRSLKIREEIGDKSGIAASLNNIGTIDNNQGDYAKAIDYYTRSLKIREQLGDKKGIAMSLNGIANIYRQQDDYVKALEKCSKALSISQEVGDVVAIKNASNTLWKTYKKLGKHSQALEMHELYIEMRDSMLSIENKEAIIQQGFKYQYEKQAAVDSVANAKERAIKEETIKRQQVELSSEKKMRYTLFGGLGIISLLLVFAINRFLVTRKQKKFIELQKKEVDHKNEEVMDSIRYAKRIQDALLTSDEYIAKALPDSFVFYKPKDIVSGDYYWVYENKKGQVFFTVADCTGHGVPGAFMSMIGTSLLNEIIIENGTEETDQILYDMRTHIINSLDQQGELGENRDGMDMAICRWDKKDNRLCFSGAYNPLYIIRNGELLEYKANRRPVGYYVGESISFTKEEITLKKEDMLYIFSDGFVDQFGGKKGKKYRTRNFKKLLLQISGLPCDEQNKELDKELADWKGETEQVDDVCMMGVRF